MNLCRLRHQTSCIIQQQLTYDLAKKLFVRLHILFQSQEKLFLAERVLCSTAIAVDRGGRTDLHNQTFDSNVAFEIRISAGCSTLSIMMGRASSSVLVALTVTEKGLTRFSMSVSIALYLPRLTADTRSLNAQQKHFKSKVKKAIEGLRVQQANTHTQTTRSKSTSCGETCPSRTPCAPVRSTPDRP